MPSVARSSSNERFPARHGSRRQSWQVVEICPEPSRRVYCSSSKHPFPSRGHRTPLLWPHRFALCRGAKRFWRPATTARLRRRIRRRGQQLFQRAINDQATAADANRYELAAFDQRPNRRIAEPAQFSRRCHSHGQPCRTVQVVARKASTWNTHIAPPHFHAHDRARMQADQSTTYLRGSGSF